MARASRSSRASRSTSPATSARRIFSATTRSRRVSSASYTSPIPPAPSRQRTSYAARRAPGTSAAIELPSVLDEDRKVLHAEADLSELLSKLLDDLFRTRPLDFPF